VATSTPRVLSLRPTRDCFSFTCALSPSYSKLSNQPPPSIMATQMSKKRKVSSRIIESIHLLADVWSSVKLTSCGSDCAVRRRRCVLCRAQRASHPRACRGWLLWRGGPRHPHAHRDHHPRHSHSECLG
jgi:hypothetical protein